MDGQVIGPRLGIRTGPRVGLATGVGSDPLGGGLDGVAIDATSSKYVPANLTQWNTTLGVAGISSGAPSFLWLCQETSGNLADSIGAVTLTATSWTSYAQTQTGWSRLALKVGDGVGANFASTSASLPDQNTTSALLMMLFARTGTPGATRPVGMIGAAAAASIVSCELDTSNHLVCNSRLSVSQAGTVDYGANVVAPVLLQHDKTNSIHRVVTHSELITTTFGALTTNKGVGLSQSAYGLSPPGAWSYAALFVGAAAELTTAQLRSLLRTLGWTVAW